MTVRWPGVRVPTVPDETVVFVAGALARLAEEGAAADRAPHALHLLPHLATHSRSARPSRTAAPRLQRLHCADSKRSSRLVVVARGNLGWCAIVLVRCGSVTWSQSVMGSVLLSNGSAHFGSASDRHTQHLIETGGERVSGHWPASGTGDSPTAAAVQHRSRATMHQRVRRPDITLACRRNLAGGCCAASARACS